MRGDLEKGAVQQVKVPGVEKKKKVARQRRKEGLAGGWREKEREGEGRGRTERCCCSRLPGCGEWVDGSKSLQR